MYITILLMLITALGCVEKVDVYIIGDIEGVNKSNLQKSIVDCGVNTGLEMRYIDINSMENRPVDGNYNMTVSVTVLKTNVNVTSFGFEIAPVKNSRSLRVEFSRESKGMDADVKDIPPKILPILLKNVSILKELG